MRETFAGPNSRGRTRAHAAPVSLPDRNLVRDHGIIRPDRRLNCLGCMHLQSRVRSFALNRRGRDVDQCKAHLVASANQKRDALNHRGPARPGGASLCGSAGAGPLSLLVSVPLLLELGWLSLGLGRAVGLGMARRRFRRIWRLLELRFPRSLLPPRVQAHRLCPPRFLPSRV